MVFDHRVEILSLRETTPKTWEWVVDARAWASLSPQKGSNLFSRVGLGARSVLISMHPRRLTLHQAIRWKGRHHFITAIDRPSPVHMEVSTALVESLACSATRLPDRPGADKQAVREPERIASFPAVLTEKYQGFEQKPAMAQVAQTFVLVTPGPVLLRTGDLVTAGTAGVFAVQVCHTLDEYKNEYEVHRKEDV